MSVEKITTSPTQLGVVDKINEIIDNLGTGVGPELKSIAVTSPPTKTTYKPGETFNVAGMVIEGTYSFGITQEVTGYTVEPKVMADGVTYVTITYAEGEVIATTTQAVTVTPVLRSISVTTNPTKTTYEYGDTFSSSGMAVTATYSNGSTAVVSGWTVPSVTFDSVGTESITVSYTEDGISVSTTLNITVTRKSISVPSQSGTLTYSGSAQSPSWSWYDSSKITLGGATSGTNAGSYTATFTPGDNYRWSDGSTSAKSVTWSIGKANGSVSLSAGGMSLTTEIPSDTLTVNRLGNGTISVNSSDTGIATVILSGTTITVTGVASGDAVVTVTVAESDNYKSASTTCNVNVKFGYSDNFEDNSWADIIEACYLNEVPETWNVGDSKAMTIGGTDYMIDIIGKNHDVFTEGGLAPLTFQFHDCYGTKYAMNSSDTNSGGYDASEMHTTHLPAILALMPAEVQAAIKPVNKKASVGDTGTDIETISCNLFLLAEIEIFGSRMWSKSGEGTQYEYYSAGNSADKGGFYWERSPSTGDEQSFCVTLATIMDMHPCPASYLFGVAPAFCFASNAPSFADASWDYVIAACQNNAVPSTWNVGDSKSMTVNGTDYQIDIIGKSHDTYTTGGTAPLTFQFHDCYAVQYQMDSREDFTGKFRESEMCSVHLPAVLNSMPAEIVDALKVVNKEVCVSGNIMNDEDITTSTMSSTLFLLSTKEIRPSNPAGVSEGSLYEYYEDNSKAIKYINGEYADYWTRTPEVFHGTGMFHYVSSSSNITPGDYLTAFHYIAPAFCLGTKQVITFYVEDDMTSETFSSTALEGMTFKEWFDSGYYNYPASNLDSFLIWGGNGQVCTSSGTAVTASDLIIPYEHYIVAN